MSQEAWALLVAIVGLLLSIGLAALRVWEHFFRRPRFKAEFRWRVTDGVVDGASLILMNVGHAKGAVLRVGFSRDDAPDYQEWPRNLHNEFPIVLDINDVSPRFDLDLSKASPFNLALRDGEITKLMIVDIQGNKMTQPLPPVPETG